MQSLAEVGLNHQHALDLQTQHQHFTANCMVSTSFISYSTFVSVIALQRLTAGNTKENENVH